MKTKEADAIIKTIIESVAQNYFFLNECVKFSLSKIITVYGKAHPYDSATEMCASSTSLETYIMHIV